MIWLWPPGQGSMTEARAGLTTSSIGAEIAAIFERFGAQIVAAKKMSFFVGPAAAIFTESAQMRFERAAGTTSPGAGPFKKFSKK